MKFLGSLTSKFCAWVFFLIVVYLGKLVPDVDFNSEFRAWAVPHFLV